MTKLSVVTITTVLLLAVASAFAADPTPGKNLYNLQIIAYDGANCPSGDFVGTNRHQIAVKANVSDDPAGLNPNTIVRQNDIMLAMGEFQVLDGNACTDGVARFQLPNNPISGLLDDPTFANYEVWLRLVGKPNTGINVKTCATDIADPTTPDDDIIKCSTESVVEVRQKGVKPTFRNYSKQLLTVCLDTTGDGACDTRLALFDPALQDFFWNWNTTGKAHAQLVFVSIPD